MEEFLAKSRGEQVVELLTEDNFTQLMNGLLCASTKCMAGRAIANLIRHSDEARRKCLHNETFTREILSSSVITEVSNNEEWLIIWIRILFLISVEREGSIRVAALINSILDLSLTVETVIDVLRMLFCIKMHGISLEASEDQKICDFVALNMSKYPDDIHIRGNCYNLLHVFQFNLIDDHYHSLCLFLDAAECEDTKHEAFVYLVHVFPVITQAAKQDDSVRQSLRDRETDARQGLSVKSQLMRCLQSTNQNLVLTAGIFIETLFQGNKVRMIWHLGYGCLAGYWYQLGMLQEANEALSALEACEINSEGHSSDEEALNGYSSNSKNIDWISGLYKE